jgi:hypothetical protein
MMMMAGFVLFCRARRFLFARVDLEQSAASALDLGNSRHTTLTLLGYCQTDSFGCSTMEPHRNVVAMKGIISESEPPFFGLMLAFYPRGSMKATFKEEIIPLRTKVKVSVEWRGQWWWRRRRRDDAQLSRALCQGCKMRASFWRATDKTLAPIVEPTHIALDSTSFRRTYIVVSYHVYASLLTTHARARSATHTAQVLYGIALGIAYCHQQGIEHRDLWPANILLDGDFTSKVCHLVAPVLHHYAVRWSALANNRCTPTNTRA